MASSKHINEELRFLACLFPRYQLTKETNAAYSIMLKNVDDDLLHAAVVSVADNCTFFPSIHEIKTAIESIQRQALSLPTPAEAWGNLLGAHGDTEVKRVKEENGINIIEVFQYQFLPGVREVAESLGWPKKFLGNDDPMADRAHFLKAYENWQNKELSKLNQHPEVTQFIESRKLAQLEAGSDK